jgi:hypothetical protein
MNKKAFFKILILGLSILFSFAQVSMADDGKHGDKTVSQTTLKANSSNVSQAAAIEGVEGESKTKAEKTAKTQSSGVNPGGDVAGSLGDGLEDMTGHAGDEVKN